MLTFQGGSPDFVLVTIIQRHMAGNTFSEVTNQLVFPDGCKGNLDSQLIKGLLTTQPHMRLGCMANGAGDIKAHAFYKGTQCLASCFFLFSLLMRVVAMRLTLYFALVSFFVLFVSFFAPP